VAQFGGNEKMGDKVSVCGGCGGGALFGLLQARLAEVALIDCMHVCGKPVALSFRGEGKAAYLFAGVDPVAQLDEILTFAGLYATARGGIVEDARPCGDLRLCLVGRIPA
jgi:predicted metal-binding protein